MCEVSRIDEGGRDVCTAQSVLPSAASGGSADDAGKKGLSRGRGTGRISHSYRCSRGCVVRMARGKTKYKERKHIIIGEGREKWEEKEKEWGVVTAAFRMVRELLLVRQDKDQKDGDCMNSSMRE